MSDRAHLSDDPGCPLLHHVYPVGAGVREHVTTGIGCWCEPHVYRVCTQCDRDPACWACEGDGIIRIDVDEMMVGDRVLVVHHYISDDVVIED